MALPDFVAPMLARAGPAFDSPDHLFEPKWDGFRALAFVEEGGVRLVSRRRNDFTPRYPEAEALRALPVGSLLDGELVCMGTQGPDFEAMLQREQARGPRIGALARALPVTYVAFDLLYAGGTSRLRDPLKERRRRLEDLVAPIRDERVVLSTGVVGGGTLFFARTGELGLEGMVAKDLTSPYEPGKRTGAWIKVKSGGRVLCAVIGYTLNEEGAFKSLVLASNDPETGALRCVGRVGSGLTEEMRRFLQERLDTVRRPSPLVACEYAARWTEPTVYCQVRFQSWTSSGTLRAPVFDGLAGDTPSRDESS